MQSLLYLASASPRRHELLNQIGVEHEVLHVPAPPGEDEPRLCNESPLEYVQRTALDKALRAQSWTQEQLSTKKKNEKRLAILTADTTVALNDLVLGKPQDKQDAKRILEQLSGQTHTVYTALVLSQTKLKEPSSQHSEWHQWRALSVTQVTFCQLTEDMIQQYIETKEPFGKAGAYGIQGHGAKFIQKINGSYSGVMGLPLFETNTLLTLMNQSV